MFAGPRARLYNLAAMTLDASLTVLSGPVHRRSLSNARRAIFERQERDLGARPAWREMEERIRRGGAVPIAAARSASATTPPAGLASVTSIAAPSLGATGAGQA